MTDPVRRVHYFLGQLLSAEDLAADQDYHRRMRYLHNRLHGWGVVEGLDVTAEDGNTVVVSAGIAIDALGREIVLASPVHLDPSTLSDETAIVSICWDEIPEAFVATSDGADEADERKQFTRWLEHPRVTLEPSDQGADDALPLARLTRRSTGEIAVDQSVRSSFRSPGPATAH